MEDNEQQAHAGTEAGNATSDNCHGISNEDDETPRPGKWRKMFPVSLLISSTYQLGWAVARPQIAIQPVVPSYTKWNRRNSLRGQTRFIPSSKRWAVPTSHKIHTAHLPLYLQRQYKQAAQRIVNKVFNTESSNNRLLETRQFPLLNSAFTNS